MARRTTARRWASVAEAAHYAGMSTRTIRQRVADGDLPAYKPVGSRLVKIDLSDVDAMIEGRGRIPAGHLDGEAVGT
jgi:excisionase family DNA binding protein